MNNEQNNYDPKRSDPRKPNPNGKKPKSIILLILAALVFTLIINTVYTAVSNSYLQPITFSEFYEMVEQDEVSKVEFQHDRILIMTKENEALDIAKQTVYYTGLIPNMTTNDLEATLREAGETVLPMVAGIVAVFVEHKFRAAPINLVFCQYGVIPEGGIANFDAFAFFAKLLVLRFIHPRIVVLYRVLSDILFA